MIRGPALPTQLIREKHAMHCFGMEFATDAAQCWRNHCEDPVKQAFSTSVLSFRSAGVEYDFDVAGPRQHLLAEISILSRPELPPCNVYGTKEEYDSYADACDLAHGTGWAVHLAQQCQEAYYHNVRYKLIPIEANDQTMQMQYDLEYWYKYSTLSDCIVDLLSSVCA